jgi:hypothetical protein
LTVFDIHPNRRPAVQTRRIDPYCLTFEKPADRQRLEPSLAEPLLLPLDGDPVLGGKIAERGERRDVTCVGQYPSGNSGGKEVVNSFPAFFNGDAQFGGNFRIERGLSRIDEMFENGIKGPVQDGCFTHRVLTSFLYWHVSRAEMGWGDTKRLCIYFKIVSSKKTVVNREIAGKPQNKKFLFDQEN